GASPAARRQIVAYRELGWQPGGHGSARWRRTRKQGMKPPRKPTTPSDPRQQAMGLLVRREQSRSELARKLKAKGAEPARIETALDDLQSRGFQDDARFAQSLARTRAAAGYGPQRIRAELGTHAIE